MNPLQCALRKDCTQHSRLSSLGKFRKQLPNLAESDVATSPHEEPAKSQAWCIDGEPQDPAVGDGNGCLSRQYFSYAFNPQATMSAMHGNIAIAIAITAPARLTRSRYTILSRPVVLPAVQYLEANQMQNACTSLQGELLQTAKFSTISTSVLLVERVIDQVCINFSHLWFCSLCTVHPRFAGL